MTLRKWLLSSVAVAALAALAPAPTSMALSSAVTSRSPVMLSPAVPKQIPAIPHDFNGDGRADVAVGVPTWDVGGRADAGAVVVLPGGDRAVGSTETVLSEASAGVVGAAQAGDRFGAALASADFNRDGYSDLAIGAPRDCDRYTTRAARTACKGAGEDAAQDAYPREQPGAVTILLGSAAGLTGSGSSRIHGGGRPWFGYALVAADFNRDGWPEVAVGAPSGLADRGIWSNHYSPAYAIGAVLVLRGGTGGFSLSRAQTVALPHARVGAFGANLAVGDVNRDGWLDLVEGWRGTYGFDEYAAPIPGHTSISLGTPDGPLPATFIGALLDESCAGFSVQVCDAYAGSTVAASSTAVGDVTGDGYDDVVSAQWMTGRYWDSTGDPPKPGRVTLSPGSAQGPVAPTVWINQDSPGIPGREEASSADLASNRRDFFDGFGSSVALLDVDRDGRLDVLVGSPGEDRDAGQVTVIRGADDGFARTGNFAFNQGNPSVAGTKEPGDFFGASLSVLDVAGSRRGDVLIGSPGENGGDGSVTVLRVAGTRWTASQALTLRGLDRNPGSGYIGFGTTVGRAARG